MHKHPSLECVTMFIFAYMPYGLSEGLGLSGIYRFFFTWCCFLLYLFINTLSKTVFKRYAALLWIADIDIRVK